MKTAEKSLLNKSKQSNIRTSIYLFCCCLTLSGVKSLFSWLLMWTRRNSKFYKSRTSHHFTLPHHSATYTQHRAVHKTISKLIPIWLIAYSFAIIVKRRGGSSKQLVTWVLTLFTSEDEVKVFCKFSKSFSSELAQQQPHIQVVWSTLVLARGGKAIPMATGKFYLGGALPVLPAVTWPGDNHQRCFPMSDSWEAPSPAGFSHLSWNEQRHQVNTDLFFLGPVLKRTARSGKQNISKSWRSICHNLPHTWHWGEEKCRVRKVHLWIGFLWQIEMERNIRCMK